MKTVSDVELRIKQIAGKEGLLRAIRLIESLPPCTGHVDILIDGHKRAVPFSAVRDGLKFALGDAFAVEVERKLQEQLIAAARSMFQETGT